MKKNVKRLVFLLLIVCLLSMGILTAGYAADQTRLPELNENTAGKFSVELTMTDELGAKTVFEGIVLELYQVADLAVNNGVPEYTWKELFADNAVDLSDFTAAESVQTAAALAETALNYPPDTAKVTDQNGCAVFSGLDHGIYLVVLKEDENTEKRNLVMAPYLVQLPMVEKTEQGYIWYYIVNSYPKTEIIEDEKQGRIVITKNTSMYSGDITEPLIVLDEIFYFGLFLDAEGTQPYSENFMKSVQLKDTSSGTAVFERLPAGTFYVFETDANGMPVKDGEKVQNPVFSYTCDLESETQKITFDPEWEVTEGQVVFNNIYDELPAGYYYEPKIRIKKKVLDGLEEIETDETFYAGIFSEQNGSYSLEQVVELEQNKTVETAFSIQLTEGVFSQKFLIFETDKDGNRVDKDTFGYTVEGEGIIEISSEDPEAEITLINRRKGENETESTYTAGGSGGRTTGSGGRTVRTGDDTPIVFYLGLLAAAAMILIILLIIRRKKA